MTQLARDFNAERKSHMRVQRANTCGSKNSDLKGVVAVDTAEPGCASEPGSTFKPVTLTCRTVCDLCWPARSWPTTTQVGQRLSPCARNGEAILRLGSCFAQPVSLCCRHAGHAPLSHQQSQGRPQFNSSHCPTMPAATCSPAPAPRRPGTAR